MRRIFASFRLKPETLQEPVVLGLQLHERRNGRHRGNHGPRLAAPERGQPVETQAKALAMNASEYASDLAGQRVVDVADETQREMIIFRIDTARARQAAPHHHERLGNSREYLPPQKRSRPSYTRPN